MIHESVLLKESMDGLGIKADGIYMDATFGRGGHSRAILEKLSDKGRLIAIDKDLSAVDYGKMHFKNDERFQIIHGSFAELENIARLTHIHGKVDGILFDLGVSSPQLDDATRGFSFMHQGPLDMRMDITASLTAATFIKEASVRELKKIFSEYGEERFSGRIASAIVKAREESPIVDTEQLAAIVKAANPKWEKHKHPATRVFQAIRIYINQELKELPLALKAAMDVLAVKGRLAVISFHSLEDRIVKQFMREKERSDPMPISVPIKAEQIKSCFKRISIAIKPQPDEIIRNVRSRSAVLRIGEKIA